MSQEKGTCGQRQPCSLLGVWAVWPPPSGVLTTQRGSERGKNGRAVGRCQRRDEKGPAVSAASVGPNPHRAGVDKSVVQSQAGKQLVQRAIIILHQGQLQRLLLFGYVSVPRVAFPQWDELLALAIEWARTKRLLLVPALCPAVYGGYWQEYAVGYRTAPLFPTPYAYNLRSAEPVRNGTLRGLFPSVTCWGRKLTTIRINAIVQAGVNLTHETHLSSDGTTHATEDGKEAILPGVQLCGRQNKRRAA